MTVTTDGLKKLIFDYLEYAGPVELLKVFQVLCPKSSIQIYQLIGDDTTFEVRDGTIRDGRETPTKRE